MADAGEVSYAPAEMLLAQYEIARMNADAAAMAAIKAQATALGYTIA